MDENKYSDIEINTTGTEYPNWAEANHFAINPLSPKSDQHQISPCNINALLNSVVMRITDMRSHTLWICLIFYQLPPQLL